jgi:hypothetical protein
VEQVNRQFPPTHAAVTFPFAGWGHAWPHVPQFAVDVERSTHALPQSVEGQLATQAPATQNGLEPPQG